MLVFMERLIKLSNLERLFDKWAKPFDLIIFSEISSLRTERERRLEKELERHVII